MANRSAGTFKQLDQEIWCRDDRRIGGPARLQERRPLQPAVGMGQVLPALAGALTGVAGGFELFTVASQGGSVSQPPAWCLIATVAGTVVAVAGLTAIPARVGARRPVAEILQSEVA